MGWMVIVYTSCDKGESEGGRDEEVEMELR
jgi:hypothetical protein